MSHHFVKAIIFKKPVTPNFKFFKDKSLKVFGNGRDHLLMGLKDGVCFYGSWKIFHLGALLESPHSLINMIRSSVHKSVRWINSIQKEKTKPIAARATAKRRREEILHDTTAIYRDLLLYRERWKFSGAKRRGRRPADRSSLSTNEEVDC